MIQTSTAFYEGYWRSNPKTDQYSYLDHILLPFPVTGKRTRKLENFIDKLRKVENSDIVNSDSYRGFSMCRLCDIDNGSQEFWVPYQDKELRWPSGLLHYCEEHWVEPSELFYQFIMGIKLEENKLHKESRGLYKFLKRSRDNTRKTDRREKYGY